ncbi:prephenate dehydratase [Fodinisporobacter ferrooxydans]|uniref:Prephenate dehydratase n=1 Tax=Fodinisporobacter ferrooxydans TaxID=2901836 RepID=A0ABY4CQ35_9BACL|nr:prephenate dehydratase [Alicyclobacillaceae bacterium MYW30-H2]
MKIGYLGPQGTFSEEASFRYFSDATIKRIPFPTFLDIFEAVQEGEIDQGIVPIENSIEGTVSVVLDGLQIYSDVFIQGEMILDIEQHLLVLENVELETLKEIWSHPQPLAQCRNFIRNLNVKTRSFDSTVAAAHELIRSQNKSVGVIGTSWAAEKLRLHMLASNIHDFPENHTRFVIVRKGEYVSEDAKKTMLLITPSEEHPGVLVNILNVFSALELNLTWLESRPTKKRLGEYQFFMKIEEGLPSERMQKAVRILALYGHSVRVLGSY